MSSSTKTPNYNLPQFLETDKPTWLGDYNQSMQLLDTVIAEVDTKAGSASADIATINSSISTLNTQVTTLTTNVTGAQQSAEQAYQKATAVEGDLNSAESNIRDINLKLSNVETTANAASTFAQEAKVSATQAGTAAASAGTAASLAQSTAEQAMTQANAAAGNASAAVNTANQASQIAQAVSAYLSLTDTSNVTFSAIQGTINGATTVSVNMARNSDKSYGKLYGYFNNVVGTGSGETIFVSPADTVKRPSADFNIVGMGLIEYTDSHDVQGLSFRIKTNGSIEIHFTNSGSGSVPCNAFLWAIPVSFDDYGDQ
jgi:outer membrane murein-binding lipoprotein Lpp